MEKIGDIGFGGQQLSEGHQAGEGSSLKELFTAVREELDAKAAITEADASDLPTAITLLNEIKALLVAADSKKFEN